MIDEARDCIASALREAKSPALWLSFGKDSLLLLHLVRELGLNPTLIWYGDNLPPQGERIIKEWGLKVFSYAPAVRYRVDDSVVSEYSIGTARFPVMQDADDGGSKLGNMTTPYFNYDFDVTLWGYKASDRHPLISTVFEREVALGPTQVVAPLYHLSDEDVLQTVEDLQVPYEAFDDTVRGDGLPVVPLTTFRQRFGV